MERPSKKSSPKNILHYQQPEIDVVGASKERLISLEAQSQSSPWQARLERHS